MRTRQVEKHVLMVTLNLYILFTSINDSSHLVHYLQDKHPLSFKYFYRILHVLPIQAVGGSNNEQFNDIPS
jgi:hypothetical protein